MITVTVSLSQLIAAGFLALSVYLAIRHPHGTGRLLASAGRGVISLAREYRSNRRSATRAPCNCGPQASNTAASP